MIEKNLVKIEITKQEARLIYYIRRLKFGDIKLQVKDGLPYRVIRYEKSILLTNLLKKDE